MSTKIVFTCEHAFDFVPEEVQDIMKFSKELLASGKSLDKGARPLCMELSALLKADGFYFPYSRLLLDSNRQLSNGAVQKRVDTLPDKYKKEFVDAYFKYRQSVFHRVDQLLEQGHRVLLSSVHTFVPFRGGHHRPTDIGLLFRTKEKRESQLAHKIRRYLYKTDVKNLKIHYNLPYRGHTDCFLNDLLNHYPQKEVNGIFLEVNQRLINSPQDVQTFSVALGYALKQAIEDWNS